MAEYLASVRIQNEDTMTFEPQLRIIKIQGLPDDDILQVPVHWHENHDEIITVLEGKLKVVLRGEIIICTPQSGEAFVPRGAPHSLESFKGVPCVFTERTTPKDFDTKELFFRNFFTLPGSPDKPGLLPVMQVFYYGDTYPVFPIHLGWLEKALVTILGGYVAPLVGYQLKFKDSKKAA